MNVSGKKHRYHGTVYTEWIVMGNFKIIVDSFIARRTPDEIYKRFDSLVIVCLPSMMVIVTRANFCFLILILWLLVEPVASISSLSNQSIHIGRIAIIFEADSWKPQDGNQQNDVITRQCLVNWRQICAHNTHFIHCTFNISIISQTHTHLIKSQTVLGMIFVRVVGSHPLPPSSIKSYCCVLLSNCFYCYYCY